MPTCVHCKRNTITDAKPAVNDNPKWVALASEHRPDCEWVMTRGGQLKPASTKRHKTYRLDQLALETIAKIREVHRFKSDGEAVEHALKRYREEGW